MHKLGLIRSFMPALASGNSAPPPGRNAPAQRSNAPAQRSNAPPQRRDAPPQRRDAPLQRRDAPLQRRDAPAQRRDAPAQRRNEQRRAEPSQRRDEQRRDAPAQRRDEQRRDAPPQRRTEPLQRRDAPLQRRDALAQRRDAPAQRRDALAQRRDAPPQRHAEPPQRRDALVQRRAELPRRQADAPPRRAGAAIAVLALAAASLGCSDPAGKEAAVESAPSPGYGAAWSEFLTPEAARPALSPLGTRGVAVALAWPSDEPSAARLQLAKDAEDGGVTLRPWLLLPEEQGYWPGSTNADAFVAAARSLMNEWEGAGLAPTALIVDMEMRWERSQTMSTLLTAEPPNPVAVVTFMRDGIDEQQYAQATERYAELADEAHGRGWQVHLTTLPQVLDDYDDDDDDLRQAFGIVVDGVAWDRVSFQAYRTLFGDLFAGTSSSRPSEFFVYEYGRDAKARFGERAGLDVGMVGAGVTPSTTYAGADELQRDLAAAAAAGIAASHVHVYNLDGMVERAPMEQWLAPAPAPETPPADQATVPIRSNIKLLDGVL